MLRAAPTLAFAHLAIACSPTVPLDFEGSYDALDAFVGCHQRIDHVSSSARYVAYELEIERDADDVYTVDLPSIECLIRAAERDDELRFLSQDCASDDRDERDIHGTARWNDDDELVIHLESSEYWHPLPDYWPDGLVWDCRHDYVLTPSP